MKFGRRLEAEADEAFRQHYIRYNVLKALLKSVSPDSAPLPDDAHTIRAAINRRLTPTAADNSSALSSGSGPEAQFMEILEDDIQRIGRFVAAQVEELKLRARALSTRVAASTTPSELNRIEASADEVAASSVRLDRFVLLNYTGFVKIVKKHDRVVTALSDAYASVRARRAGAALKAGAWVPPSNFERSTTKYWVAPEDVLAVKCALVKHLPVLIFGRSEGGGGPGALLAAAGNEAAEGDVPSDSSLISSVYFDNSACDVYYERLERQEGARLVRIRWYGESAGGEDELFVERKTHHESWTTDTSVKERFRLKGKHVSPFLKGELELETQLKKLRSAGASEADVARTRALAAEVCHELRSRSLAPALRTVYYRTAFQLSSSNAVRVSLDTQLRMLDERGGCSPGLPPSPAHNKRGSSSSSAWCRSLDASATPVGPQEVVEFPFAVLEIKLQDETPKWVAALLSSGRLVQCAKFSKFLHGTAALRPHEVSKVPHWWDDDSVVPSTAAPGAPPPVRVLSQISMGIAENGSVDDLAALPSRFGAKSFPQKGGLPRSMSAPTAMRLEEDTVIAVVQSPREEQAEPAAGGCLTRRTSSLKAWLRCSGSASVSPIPKAAGAGGATKRHVPIKIEPKTFFANERTMLQWLHISILILFTSLSLVTDNSLMMGSAQASNWRTDHSSKLAGAVLAPVSVIFIVYALFTYLWRAQRIARREPSARYDDRFGPAVLVLLLLSVTITSIALAISHADWSRHPPVQELQARGVQALGVGRKADSSKLSSLLSVGAGELGAILSAGNATGCATLPVVWPPFFRPRGAALLAGHGGQGDAVLVGGDYSLASVSLGSGGNSAPGEVRLLPAPSWSVSAVAVSQAGEVLLGAARPQNTVGAYDLSAQAVTHATSLDGPALLGAEQAISAMASGPDDTLFMTGPSGVEVLSLSGGSAENASQPLSWSAVRLLSSEQLSAGLSSSHVSGLAYNAKSGQLLLLFPRAQPAVLRGWHLGRGALLGDWPLPSGQPAAAAAGGRGGDAWSGVALSKDGHTAFLTRSQPPQLWRLALGPAGLPTCAL